MTVIITMAGMGSRFRQAGYTEPKYRIKARGRTLFDWSLLSLQAFFSERFIFVCLKSEDTEWIRRAANSIGITETFIVSRSALSRGQAETAFDALDKADEAEPLWIYNIDTHVAPLAMKPQDLTGAAGCLHVFTSTEPNMSFVRFDEHGEAVEVAEKRPISTWASVGLYGFQSAATFSDLYRESYQCDRISTAANEQYVAPMYDMMLRRGDRIVAPKLSECDVYILGTPEQVQAFDPSVNPPKDGINKVCAEPSSCRPINPKAPQEINPKDSAKKQHYS